MTTDRFLVTGASGFIGQYVVRRLLRRDATVRVLVRTPSKLSRDLRGQVEIVEGDIRDDALVERAARGVHTVLHLAACAKAWARDPSEFKQVNIDVVESLLSHSERHGVERLVHVSTILTLPPYQSAPLSGRALQSTPYEISKKLGEGLVEGFARAGNHAVIVHPARVYGPGPLYDANSVTKAIDLYMRGRLRVRLADRDVLGSYVHADDVAAGILRAAECGASGAHYVLGGDNVSFRQLLQMVNDIVGRSRAMVALPARGAVSVASLAELMGRVGGTPPITAGWVRILLEDRRANIQPACGDLGYEPRPLRKGLAETIEWLNESATNGRAV